MKNRGLEANFNQRQVELQLQNAAPHVEKLAASLVRSRAEGAGKTAAQLGEVNGMSAPLLSLLRGEEEGPTVEDVKPQTLQGGTQRLLCKASQMRGLSAEQRAMLFID